MVTDPGRSVTRDAETIVIHDKFPKSKHHFLVMPTRPVDGFKHLSKYVTSRAPDISPHAL